MVCSIAGALPPQILEGFRQGLRDLGYVEGQNLVIELWAAEGSTERLCDGAAALVQLQVDMLVGAAAIRAALHVRYAIPRGRQGAHRLSMRRGAVAWVR